MSVRVFINGEEVESPLARFLIGFLGVVILTLLGVLFVIVILPLIGITLVLSFGIFALIVLASFVSILIALAAYNHHDRKKKRLE